MGHHKTNTPASHYNKMIFTVNIAKEAPKNLVVKDKWKKLGASEKKKLVTSWKKFFQTAANPTSQEVTSPPASETF